MAEITKPSSLNKIWARIGGKRTPSDLKIDQGWVVEIPTFQDFNFLFNKHSAAIAHINQMGAPMWDSTTEYIANKSYCNTNAGDIYKCIATNTNQNPLTDTSNTYWQLRLKGTAYSKEQTILTLQNSWTNLTGISMASVNSGVLFVYGNIAAGTTAGTVTVATLPAGYRPTLVDKVVSSIFYNGSTYSPYKITVKTTGEIQVTGISNNTDVLLNFTVEIT
jgi:hypothetical protein